ncbi:ATP-binding cassette domain-containing protein [Sphingobium yanoikuyae]|uniref:ATP-binding cassette domain-containing protein n=1 Tax=Sphingobium yanoikuyae TaxID=13690 RepID=UPI00345E931D
MNQPDPIGAPTVDPVVRLSGVRLHYGKTQALRGIDLDIPGGRMIGLIGPDGVGKSSLLSLVAGAHVIQDGDVHVLGGDMRDKRHRSDVCPRIAYMPQGLGKNLYPTLSVEENLQFFGRLFGHDGAERRRRIDALTRATGLDPFLARPAGKLSGGMKQKLGLCCALIHDPDLLILDEPTTGVDPLARAQFWDLINDIRQTQAQMSVIVATAYMDEAQRFDWLVAMDDGQILDTGTPAEISRAPAPVRWRRPSSRCCPRRRSAAMSRSSSRRSKPARMTSRSRRRGWTMRFGDFTAVDHVSFRNHRGEIFGFLGSNGCGKTTTMMMLDRPLCPRPRARLGCLVMQWDPDDMSTRKRVGYRARPSRSTTDSPSARIWNFTPISSMSRARYSRPRRGNGRSVRSWPGDGGTARQPAARHPPAPQPCVAMVHKPELLILDEPTSGVDPWRATASGDCWRNCRGATRSRSSSHPFHERGDALRPHVDDARRPCAGQRCARAPDREARRARSGTGLHRLSGRCRRRHPARPTRKARSRTWRRRNMAR